MVQHKAATSDYRRYYRKKIDKKNITLFVIFYKTKEINKRLYLEFIITHPSDNIHTG